MSKNPTLLYFQESDKADSIDTDSIMPL
ncbi:3-isopropylmalate dehydrogenase [Caenorhabditis elegans]|uniref:3-isopropylmalate dehydrogenase n=1 Tax=Caenorhabditis elegans TaxID=6239 RepID=D3KFX2_CAEEL|nr:3-isopropylmalate dehydrogenase [Caenorhabditis elegans]CBJ25082.1 3-isopropylmalate dehydrogenase [Caenorhabditis elegans]|eukprot:NP_001255792.1 Uncharacterized protein CELE_H12I19.115 [Caenorhabditis elegans]